MTTLFEMYITLMPVILAGILNMIWVKLPYLSSWAKPIDCSRCLRDGRRVFGENKTWKGFFGMVAAAVTATLIWGNICEQSAYLTELNYLYRNHSNSFFYNAVMGFYLGMAYALCELPNSFIKRRINIKPGKKGKGLKGVLFVFIDQADSILGCVLVIAFVYNMSFPFYLFYVCVGAFTHIIINVLLYFLKLRKNMF